MSFSLIISFLLLAAPLSATEIPESKRSRDAVERHYSRLSEEFSKKGLSLGQEVFIRIFKESRELEVWIRSDGQYRIFKTYKICTYSGGLGTKTERGDWKSPEGFYYVEPKQLNPWSKYHLAFNIGYPNLYDRANGYSGGSIMVHGDCVSIGCYAVGNDNIEEIWTIITSAFSDGQKFFRVHIFPFRMTDANLEKHKNSDNFSFWKNIKKGYDWFERKRIPPDVGVFNKKYVFRESE